MRGKLAKKIRKLAEKATKGLPATGLRMLFKRRILKEKGETPDKNIYVDAAGTFRHAQNTTRATYQQMKKNYKHHGDVNAR